MTISLKLVPTPVAEALRDFDYAAARKAIEITDLDARAKFRYHKLVVQVEKDFTHYMDWLIEEMGKPPVTAAPPFRIMRRAWQRAA